MTCRSLRSRNARWLQESESVSVKAEDCKLGVSGDVDNVDWSATPYVMGKDAGVVILLGCMQNFVRLSLAAHELDLRGAILSLPSVSCGCPSLFIFVTASATLCMVVRFHIHTRVWSGFLRHGCWQGGSVKGAWRRLGLLWDGLYEEWVRLEGERWVVRVKALEGRWVRICIL